MGAWAGAVRREGLKCRMPRPLVVVHSGKTTTTRVGWSVRRVWRSVSGVLGGGDCWGGAKVRRRACRRVRRWTWRVVG